MNTCVACGLLVSALVAMPALAHQPAREPGTSAPKPSSSIFRVDPATRIEQAGTAGAAGATDPDARWNRLGRLSSTTTVMVHLRGGWVLNGTIQGVKPESLDFVERKNVISVKIADIKTSHGGLSNDMLVELHLLDGRTLSGKIIEADSDSLTFVRTGTIVELNRQEILRIRQRVGGKMRLVGLAAGFVVGAVVGEISRRNAVARNSSVRYELEPLPAELAIIGAGAGAWLAPIVRSEKTLWEAPAKTH